MSAHAALAPTGTINPERDYRPYLQSLSAAYAAAEAGADPAALPAWEALADHSRIAARAIRAGTPVQCAAPNGGQPHRSVRVDVEETDDPEPYETAARMRRDILHGRYVVSRANCEHPCWAPADNLAFRIVHDVLGHGRSGGDFGWHGEVAACGAHFPLLTPLASRALLTECLAQTGYAIARGGFTDQRVVLLPDPLGLDR